MGLDYTVAGFGKDAASALRAAETRLPYPIKEPKHYSGFKVRDAVKAEGGQFKVEIKYGLPGKKADVPEKRQKASSAGPQDPKHVTSNLTQILS